MLPGTERLLAELDAAAQQLGRSTWTIVTSCTRPLFEARWATTGLPLPDGLVTADQVTDGKPDPEPYLLGARRLGGHPIGADRKSTRLNSSHVAISYAVFCSKKKTLHRSYPSATWQLKLH